MYVYNKNTHTNALKQSSEIQNKNDMNNVTQREARTHAALDN